MHVSTFKECKQASTLDTPQHPGSPRIPLPPNLALKDTSTNVTAAFHQTAAATPGMQAFSSHRNNTWASGSNWPNPSIEYEKKTQQTDFKSLVWHLPLLYL